MPRNCRIALVRQAEREQPRAPLWCCVSASEQWQEAIEYQLLDLAAQQLRSECTTDQRGAERRHTNRHRFGRVLPKQPLFGGAARQEQSAEAQGIEALAFE